LVNDLLDARELCILKQQPLMAEAIRAALAALGVEVEP
jgi:hypothetical protein